MHFTVTKTRNKVIFTKSRVVKSLEGPSETGKSQVIYHWLKNGTFYQNLINFTFYQHPQPLYAVIQKETGNLEFVQCVNFDFIDSLKNNGTKNLSIFDNSYDKICNSESFLDIVTAGRCRELSTIDKKHTLFHQSKLGWDVELQNTHIFLFESAHNVMQVNRLSAQLGLGSEPVDWYRDATSVPYGHLLIDLSSRTDDPLRFCTNTGSIPSKFYIPDRLKQSKFLDDDTKNHSTLQVFQSFSHKCKSFFLQSFPKESIRFLWECIVNLLKRNLQSIKIHLATKLQNEVRLGSLKRITWKQRRDVLASEKGLQLIKVITPPVINHLSWHGAVCSRSCLCIQHKSEYLVSYRPGTSKVSTFTKSHVPNWFD